ncbi:MAG: SRPBCC domain-containing protein [Candidatus Aquilonibacter sp.]
MTTTTPTEYFTFSIQRTYDAPSDRVFRALTNVDEKAKWFSGPPGQFTPLERTIDLRVGGKERLKGVWSDGSTTDFQATYCDIVPDSRLVYTYDMYVNARRISVSLATVVLTPVGTRTQFDVTEHVVYLDTYPTEEDRRRGSTGIEDRKLGSEMLFDLLGGYLQ